MIVFPTCADCPRPVRLSEETRAFAERSLAGIYGRDAREHAAATLDHVPDFAALSPLEKYNAAVTALVSQSRLRVVPGEKLSGSADFGMAMFHRVPVTFGGQPVFSSSVSHVTPDFARLLRFGMDDLEKTVLEKLSDKSVPVENRPFLESCLHCLREMRRWHGRYIGALSQNPAFADTVAVLRKVPFGPAETFREALQSLWFAFAFLRLCGNWPGIGRIDWLLGPYLEKDLADGTLTLDEARELLAHFFIKGCEWVSGGNYGSGDGQHYQNLILSGVDTDGKDVTNAMTWLVLDVLEELNIGDFPTTVRVGRQTSEALLRRVAEVMKHGGGALAVYGEDTVLDGLTYAGYPLEEARTFTNDGCWEVQIPGKTYFTYFPLDALDLLLTDTLGLSAHPEDPLPTVEFATYEELRSCYFRKLEERLLSMLAASDQRKTGSVPGFDWSWGPTLPCTVLSLFMPDCIERGKSYLDGGCSYFVVSPHLGGAADAGNSLRVIDQLCFREKRLPLTRLREILQKNWEGEEPLRQYVRNRISVYGNDDETADRYTADVADTFAALVHKHRDDTDIRYVPGISTFGREIGWRHHRPASPHGYRRGDVLSPNMSATPGTDLAGATALVRSYCRLDLSKQTTGAALDLKLTPSAVKGEAGTMALASLLATFAELGGFFLQPDVVDGETLRRAQEEPERYGSLAVRVSGWNARFVTLDREWQEMCIRKTEQKTL